MSTSVAFKQKSLFRAVPGLFSQRRLFNPATPFDNASVAQQTLEAILDSLGGILWSPDQHNYTLPTDTAVAAMGAPVGYMGSHRQNLPENYIKNSMMAGASAGVAPTNWVFSLTTANGVAVTINGAGTDADGTYLEIAMSGTAGGTSTTIIIQPNGAASNGLGTHAPAALHQLWSSSFKFKGVSGTQKAIARIIREGSGTAYGSFTIPGSTTPANGAATTVTQSRINIDTATTWVAAYFQITVGVASGTWDNVFRIYAPQLERGKPTAFTPTYGEAISRGVNFEPAWQDTTANKPLLGTDVDGKSILTFDGTNDFFRTGIQTPEAGYIAGVWQTSSTSISIDLFSSSNGTVAGARLIKNGTERALLQRADGVGATQVTHAGTWGSGKRVVDGHYQLTGAAVRLDGAGEVTNSASRAATSTNYFRIGAAGAGGDSQANYWLGTMLAQVWIPGERPGATIEAQIRTLLAELTAVSGVV